jgi:hypothetical protein
MIISGTFILAAFMYFSKYVILTFTTIDPLPFLKAHDGCMATLDLLYLIYAFRVRWTRTPRLMKALALLWYLFISFCILTYEIIPIQDSRFVLFATMRNDNTLPVDAGFFSSTGNLILSINYSFLIGLFRAAVFFFILYLYITMDIPIRNKKAILLRRIWIVTLSTYLTQPLLDIANGLYITNIPNHVVLTQFIVVITLILVTYITVFNLEGVLLNHTQLFRAFKLYKRIENLKTSEEIDEFGMASLVRYMKSIPPELMTTIEKEHK